MGSFTAAAERDSEIVRQCYEAALDPEQWPAVMQALRQAFDADSSLLRLYDGQCSRVELTLTDGFDPSFQALYSERFVRADPVRAAAERLPCTRIVSLDEVLSFSHLRRSEFYADYLRPQDKRHIVGGPLLREQNAFALFGLQRGRLGVPFDRRRCERLQALAPHLQQALRVRRQMAQLQERCQALSTFLDRAPCAVIFLDGGSRVVMANAAAERHLEARRHLSVRHGVLYGASAPVQRQLQRLVWKAQQSHEDIGIAGGGAINLGGGGTSDGPLCILVAPWCSPFRADVFGASRIRVVVMLGSASATRRWRTTMLASAWGLTMTEARLVGALVDRGELAAAAAELGIRMETARGYLKSVFRKTGCHRQAELMGMVARMPFDYVSALPSRAQPATIRTSGSGIDRSGSNAMRWPPPGS